MAYYHDIWAPTLWGAGNPFGVEMANLQEQHLYSSFHSYAMYGWPAQLAIEQYLYFWNLAILDVKNVQEGKAVPKPSLVPYIVKQYPEPHDLDAGVYWCTTVWSDGKRTHREASKYDAGSCIYKVAPYLDDEGGDGTGAGDLTGNAKGDLKQASPFLDCSFPYVPPPGLPAAPNAADKGNCCEKCCPEERVCRTKEEVLALAASYLQTGDAGDALLAQYLLYVAEHMKPAQLWCECGDTPKSECQLDPKKPIEVSLAKEDDKHPTKNASYGYQLHWRWDFRAAAGADITKCQYQQVINVQYKGTKRDGKETIPDAYYQSQWVEDKISGGINTKDFVRDTPFYDDYWMDMAAPAKETPYTKLESGTHFWTTDHHTDYVEIGKYKIRKPETEDKNKNFEYDTIEKSPFPKPLADLSDPLCSTRRDCWGKVTPGEAGIKGDAIFATSVTNAMWLFVKAKSDKAAKPTAVGQLNWQYSWTNTNLLPWLVKELKYKQTKDDYYAFDPEDEEKMKHTKGYFAPENIKGIVSDASSAKLTELN